MKTVYVANVKAQCVVAGKDEREARRVVIHSLMDFMEYDSDIELTPLTKDNLPDGYEDWCSPYNSEITIGQYFSRETNAKLEEVKQQIQQYQLAINELENERRELEKQL
jgi:hypothetical protein